MASDKTMNTISEVSNERDRTNLQMVNATSKVSLENFNLAFRSGD